MIPPFSSRYYHVRQRSLNHQRGPSGSAQPSPRSMGNGRPQHFRGPTPVHPIPGASPVSHMRRPSWGQPPQFMPGGQPPPFVPEALQGYSSGRHCRLPSGAREPPFQHLQNPQYHPTPSYWIEDQPQPWGGHEEGPMFMTDPARRDCGPSGPGFLGTLQIHCEPRCPLFGGVGPLVLFFLCFNIRFEQYKFEPGTTEHRDVLRSYKTRAGRPMAMEWPVVIIHEKAYVEPFSILRMLATMLGMYGTSPEANYVADVLVSKCQLWKEIQAMTFSQGTVDKGEFAHYVRVTRPKMYKLFNALIVYEASLRHNTMAIWVHPIIASCIMDDMILDEYRFEMFESCEITKDHLEKNPHLNSWWKGFIHECPKVVEYIQKEVSGSKFNDSGSAGGDSTRDSQVADDTTTGNS